MLFSGGPRLTTRARFLEITYHPLHLPDQRVPSCTLRGKCNAVKRAQRKFSCTTWLTSSSTQWISAGTQCCVFRTLASLRSFTLTGYRYSPMKRDTSTFLMVACEHSTLTTVLF